MVHVFNSRVTWKEGRKGDLICGNGHKCEFTAPVEFLGEPGLLTGMDAFVAGVNMNFMQTFLTFSEREKVALRGYEADANGIVGQRKGADAIIRMVIHPKIAVASEEDNENMELIIQNAKKHCILVNSVVAKVIVEYKVEISE